MENITVYGTKKTRAFRVLWLLEEMNTPYQMVAVDPHKGDHLKSDYLDINPFGKVPAVKCGDFVLAESGAIMTYLADKFSLGQFIPQINTPERGLYYQWMFFGMSELDAHLWNYVRHAKQYPSEVRSPVAADMAKKEFSQNLKVLGTHFKEENFILGKNFSAADIMISGNLSWAKALEIDLEFKELYTYLERVKSRPAYLRVMKL